MLCRGKVPSRKVLLRTKSFPWNLQSRKEFCHEITLLLWEFKVREALSRSNALLWDKMCFPKLLLLHWEKIGALVLLRSSPAFASAFAVKVK